MNPDERRRSPRPPWLTRFPLDHCIEVNGDVLAPLGERLACCTDLVHVADAAVKDAWSRPDAKLKEANEHAQLALFRRGRLLLESAVDLVGNGYSEQAFPILRVLFESMLDGYWVLIHSGEVEHHLLEHDELQRHEFGEHLRGTGSELAPRFPSLKDASARRRRLGGSWTGMSLWSRIIEWESRDIPELRLPDDEPGRLRETYNITIRLANLHVHGSMTGIFGREDRELIVGQIPYVDDPPEQWAAHVIAFFTYWCFDRLARITLAARKHTPAELNRLADETSHVWAIVTAEQQRRIGRNDPCPCGHGEDAGMKFKHCHGRATISQDRLRRAFDAVRVMNRA